MWLEGRTWRQLTGERDSWLQLPSRAWHQVYFCLGSRSKPPRVCRESSCTRQFQWRRIELHRRQPERKRGQFHRLRSKIKLCCNSTLPMQYGSCYGAHVGYSMKLPIGEANAPSAFLSGSMQARVNLWNHWTPFAKLISNWLGMNMLFFSSTFKSHARRPAVASANSAIPVRHQAWLQSPGWVKQHQYKSTLIQTLLNFGVIPPFSPYPNECECMKPWELETIWDSHMPEAFIGWNCKALSGMYWFGATTAEEPAFASCWAIACAGAQSILRRLRQTCPWCAVAEDDGACNPPSMARLGGMLPGC